MFNPSQADVRRFFCSVLHKQQTETHMEAIETLTSDAPVATAAPAATNAPGTSAGPLPAGEGMTRTVLEVGKADFLGFNF